MSARTKRAAVKSSAGSARGGRRPVANELAWVALLVVAHLVLVVWGAAKQSVTFDENFHLPSGILAAARRELRVSAVNPPLVKALAGAAALAAGARVPPDSAMGSFEQGEVGMAFMRENASHYHHIFFAARMVTAVFSVLLLLVVWRWSRRLWGPRGALVSLAFAAFAPEILAHAGVATLDVPTAFAFMLSLFTWQVFVTRGRWRDWIWAALAVGFAFNARFTAVFLAPLLLALLVMQLLVRRVRHVRRAFVGYLLLAPAALLAIQIGYLGHPSFSSFRQWSFLSEAFQGLQKRMPDLRLPIPNEYLLGLDRQAVESQVRNTPAYLLGQIHDEAPLAYFPIAFAVKWPLGFLAAIAVLAAYAIRRRPRWTRQLWPLSLALLFLFVGMFIGRLGIGIRYLLPIVPALAVCFGAIASCRLGDAPGWRRAIIGLAMLQAIEASAHAPWHLSFYNVLAGGPARGQWIVNDSAVDWGQGLIALREELQKRGIHRIHLAYHGTTEPSVYGIDYVPYLGGIPNQESDWLAVSSYYFVGLSQRMSLREGRTEKAIKIDFRPLWSRTPEAMPAGCMLLFKLR